MTFEKLLG